MRVGWITDYVDVVGGAEVTSKYLASYLAQNDCVAEFCNIQDDNNDYDIYVLTSFRRCDPQELRKFLSDKKYVLFLRDIIDMTYDQEKIIKWLYLNAVKGIFLSPLHVELFSKKYNIDVIDPLLYIPYFDIESYANNSNSDKKDNICWLNSFYSHKGLENCLLWARENGQHIDCYGKGNPNIALSAHHSKYSSYLGDIKHEYVPNILNQYKYFIHLPDVPEAFGRSVAEAFLSGCTCILDEKKIGFCSWKFKDSEDFINKMISSQEAFLNTIKARYELTN